MLPWTTYQDMRDAVSADPDGFWLDAARRIAWTRPPAAGCVPRTDGWHDWFPGGWLNTCHNAVDRHVAAGRGGQAALVWQSCATKEEQIVTYADLQRRVAGFAGGLRALGVEKGDRVLIAMPTLVETAIAMLACARLGAVHVVVFAGYAAPELARRIDDVAPKIVIIASCSFQGSVPVSSYDVLAEALALAAHAPDACVVLQRPACPARLAPGDHDFHGLERHAPAAPVPVKSEDPLYILHTSGTTGASKGIVRDNGGHAVALALSMELIYGCRAGDVFFTTSDLGWVVGHSYGVYAPLLGGCTSVIMEGGASASSIAALCRARGVTCLFTTPTQLRLLRQAERGAAGGAPLALARVFVAGEYADPTLLDWARSYFRCPVANHWWQTETGWSITAHFLGLPEEEAPSAMNDIGRPAPGFNAAVGAGDASGEILLALPLPPGCLAGVWMDGGIQAPRACLDATGRHYRTFDEGTIGADGAVHMLGRSDDVIKVAGRRISGVQIEAIIARHPAVHACAVVAVADGLRGQRPVAYVVPDAWPVPPARAGEIIEQVGRGLGRWVGIRDVRFVAALPTTRSGKILRRRLAVA
ncbi:AMP-dependent synthetase and ligase [Gluconacetobacter diazotrophicus PA1 5]|uniref:AMP-binding protein n=1 Tax=Gluconacetobacter diazotrophicus TaxID=33996 RepID=UPI000173DC32|nr:AMP-binding protein [Gluconacetobacter diazotrophicus]ACI52368.1 AMP-dependent synthetase and ligase [Gluconacetobacter diazotrophicus PA1 5]TWB05536.1 propionyl-CoA synthetase [Gluconacetobacter diazotrophicus]